MFNQAYLKNQWISFSALALLVTLTHLELHNETEQELLIVKLCFTLRGAKGLFHLCGDK
jgi:hypothetical protein